MAESKSSKKNRKRRSGAGKKEERESVGFTIEEDIGGQSSESAVTPKSPPTSIDPIGDLKRQLTEAKASKDHDKAQELRHQLWVLQDTVLLGKAGPGAPTVDVTSIISPQKTVEAKVVVSPSTSDPTEKKLLKLRKKLEQVDALKQRQAKGEQLEKNQLLKIETQSEIEEEITLLEDLLRTSTIR